MTIILVLKQVEHSEQSIVIQSVEQICSCAALTHLPSDYTASLSKLHRSDVELMPWLFALTMRLLSACICLWLPGGDIPATDRQT